MASKKITIALGDADGHVSIEALSDALEKTLRMLRGIEEGFTSAGTVVRWEVVRVKMQSPLEMTIEPRFSSPVPKTTGERIVAATVKGLASIEKRAVAPRNFNVESLKALKDLVSVAEKEQAPLSIRNGKGRKVVLTPAVAKHVDEVVAKARRYKDISTIEGSLEMVSTHRRPSFFVWESGTNHRVECLVAGTADLKQYVDYLGKRVAVTGRVSYLNHIPRTIEVESLHVLPSLAQSPRLEDMEPIDISGDEPPEDYIRRMRDG
jgi:hypothetical protein